MVIVWDIYIMYIYVLMLEMVMVWDIYIMVYLCSNVGDGYGVGYLYNGIFMF